MRLTKYAHSCLRVEHDGAVLVVDPGCSATPRRRWTARTRC